MKVSRDGAIFAVHHADHMRQKEDTASGIDWG